MIDKPFQFTAHISDGSWVDQGAIVASITGPGQVLLTAEAIDFEHQDQAVATALAEAIEKRDPYTGGHVRRVVSYSLLLGIEMGLTADERVPKLGRCRARSFELSCPPSRSATV